MKKTYMKPLISVEELTLDQPIAGNCSADKYIMESLVKDFGYFNAARECSEYMYPGPNGTGLWVDGDYDGKPDYENGINDSLCYHSNAQIAFYS